MRKRGGENGFHCRRKMMKKNVEWKGDPKSFVLHVWNKESNERVHLSPSAYVPSKSNSHRSQNMKTIGADMLNKERCINRNAHGWKRNKRFDCHAIVHWLQTILFYMSICKWIPSESWEYLIFLSHDLYNSFLCNLSSIVSVYCIACSHVS